MDQGSFPQGGRIYFWFSVQPDLMPLSLCTQGVEGGELTGAYPSKLVRSGNLPGGFGIFEITKLALPQAT